MASLAHPAVRLGSGAAGVVSAGVSVSEVTNAATGAVIAVIALVTLVVSVARNNRKNRERVRRERRKVFRAGYMKRDRELAQVVSDASYWRGYALEHRKANAPTANPPVIIPAPLPADDDDPGDDEEDGDA
jgi:membrane protein implicated in regulation of membrane protease activity